MNSTKLFNSFREHNLTGNEIDKYVIESIYIQSLLTDWEISILDTKIITYMVSKKEKEYIQYLDYLKKSKPIIHLNMNFVEIEKNTKERIEYMKKIIGDLEAGKSA